MAVANPVELSGYIISMAVSARLAQAVMSAGTDPMTIDKFEFKVNIRQTSRLKVKPTWHLTSGS